MKSADYKKDVIRYWWNKAEESIESAQREYRAESFNFAMNRLYFAAFYAVSAVLFSKDILFKKHSGVRSAFHSQLIKKEIINSEWAKFYDQLFRDRQESDYIALANFEAAYVAEKLSRCKNFLQEMRPLISHYVD